MVQFPFQKLTGIGDRVSNQLLRCSAGHHLSPFLTPFGTKVNDIISGLDHLHVMFDHDYCITPIGQSIENVEQSLDICKMEPSRGFIENIDRLSRLALA